MSLSAFLISQDACEKEVIISDRFKNEKGKLVPFKIKTITTKEAQSVQKNCLTTDKKGVARLDLPKYQLMLVATAVVYPDLKSTELQAHYGVIGECALLETMLLIGEFATLREEVFSFSGIDDDINDDIEEAKN